MTSNVNKVYPFEVLLSISDSGMTKISKAQCHQLITISKQRISNKKIQGVVNAVILPQINAVFKYNLDII